MADYRVPMDDLQFILFDLFALHLKWPEWRDDLDRETAEAIMEEAAKLCEQVIAPLNQLGDEQGCKLSEGNVVSPQGFKAAYQAYSDAEWGALGGNPEYGGMGMPKALVATIEEMLQGACMAFGLAPMLTSGACLALDSHASDELKTRYLPKMYQGHWSGAMDLTEPHAGTDLGLLRTRAEPNDDGSYRITGSKIFITWGEHDMAENIVHLVLARASGSPEGTKGISMFLVPKWIPDEQGELVERNALYCSALEKKMGIKGSPTCVMNFDGAKGWLVGELNRGLACMFTMMNYERLAVGMQALAVSHWAYLNAVEYAQSRLQGNGAFASGGAMPDNLLSHPDVRRMLLTCKAYNEGARALYVYVAQFLDAAKFSRDDQERSRAHNRIELLTPVVKAFLSDKAFDCAVQAQQVFGGHGYIREWGQEQFVRDIRITQIYEGTNGVQAMDLVGRKVLGSQGDLLTDFIAEIDDFCQIERALLKELDIMQPLEKGCRQVAESTQWILERAAQDPADPSSVAVEYLHLLGHLCLSYMWARMLIAAREYDDPEFSAAKRVTGDFYFQRLAPLTTGLADAIKGGAGAMRKMRPDWW